MQKRARATGGKGRRGGSSSAAAAADVSGCVRCGASATLLLRCGHKSCFTCLLSCASRCPACGTAVQAFEGGLHDGGCALCHSLTAQALPACGHTLCDGCLRRAQPQGECPICHVPVAVDAAAADAEAEAEAFAAAALGGGADEMFGFGGGGGSPQPIGMTDDGDISSFMPPAVSPQPILQQQQQQQQPPQQQQPQVYAMVEQQQQQQQQQPPREFDRQVVLVTGASQGIGAATAREFALRGARVVVNYHSNKAHAEAVVRYIKHFGGEAAAIQADVASEEQVRRLVSQTVSAYGRIDVLVCNAGIAGPIAALHEMSLADWHAVMHTNVDGVFFAMRAVAPIMIRQGYGRIVSVSSASINLLPALRAAYNAGKAAVEALSKTFAKEIGRNGITVNCVAPGTVRTASMQSNISRLARTTGKLMEELTAELQERTAIGRFCEPEEVAQAIVFLASRNASAINGAVLEVSGGQV